MKYFLAIMACIMLDVIDPIEPVGCSRDTEGMPDNVESQVEQPVQTPAE